MNLWDRDTGRTSLRASVDLGPAPAGLRDQVRLAVRAVLGPSRSWSADGALTDARTRLLRRALARHGGEVWNRPDEGLSLSLGPRGPRVRVGGPDSALTRTTVRLLALAEALGDRAPPALLALSTVLQACGYARIEK